MGGTLNDKLTLAAPHACSKILLGRNSLKKTPDATNASEWTKVDVPKLNQSGTGILHDAVFNDFCDHDFRANR